MNIERQKLRLVRLSAAALFCCAVPLLLASCTKPGPEQRLDNYLTRLARTLDFNPVSSPMTPIPKPPKTSDLRLQLPSANDVDAAAAALVRLGVPATEPKLHPEYNPDYYATSFTDPDGIRLELVCRTPYRDDIVKHWSDFTVFLNPLAELRSRKE